MLGGINIAGLCCCPATVGSNLFWSTILGFINLRFHKIFSTFKIFNISEIFHKNSNAGKSVLFQKTFQPILECTRNFSTIAWWDSWVKSLWFSCFCTWSKVGIIIKLVEMPLGFSCTFYDNNETMQTTSIASRR